MNVLNWRGEVVLLLEDDVERKEKEQEFYFISDLNLGTKMK